MTNNNNLTINRAMGLLLSLWLFGCNAPENTTPSEAGNSITLDMALPDSLTGGQAAVVSSVQVLAVSKQDSGVPCSYLGPEDDQDPFRNGYEMTKFMVSAVAAWSCIADELIVLADQVPHDGSIYQTENDMASENYDPQDPTHYSVTDDSASQTTVRLYYGYDRFVPPLPDEDPQFYVSWNEDGDGAYHGRLIIDAIKINEAERKADDPTIMRMDFQHTSAQQHTDMYLSFDDNNVWANGMRIEVNRDLTASPLQQVYVARGMMDMKQQFFNDTGIPEVPLLKVYAVSDDFGKGAAIADMQDVALPLELNAATGNHLGNYLFSKTDIYAFKADGDWDWVEKSITSAEYRGGRTTPQVGGTLDPFNPSLEGIALYLNLNTTDQTYFSGDACNTVGDDCTALLNAIFADGFADQEPNQGADPMDWRSAAIAAPDYLGSVYPNGVDWNGVFDYTFTP
jgi:hypothetical protein